MASSSKMADEEPALDCRGGDLEPDSDVVESLLRTLEEMTDTALSSDENSDRRTSPSVCRLLETPLENFYNAMAGRPKECADVSYLPEQEGPQELMTNISFCGDVESIYSEVMNALFRDDVESMKNAMTTFSDDVEHLQHTMTSILSGDHAVVTQQEATLMDDKNNSHTSICHEAIASTTHDRNDVIVDCWQTTFCGLGASQSAGSVEFPSSQSSGIEAFTITPLTACLSVDPANTHSVTAEALDETFHARTTSRGSLSEDNSNDLETCAQRFGNQEPNSAPHATETLVPESNSSQAFSDALSNGSDSNTSTESTKRFETCFSSLENLLRTIDVEGDHLSGDPNNGDIASTDDFRASSRYDDVTSLSDPSSESSLDSWSNSSGKPSSSSARSTKGVDQKKRKTVTSSVRQLPPCRVCAQPAAGLHYGVNTCEACKGFFRRSLLRNIPYKCKGNGTCDVNGAQKRICPACRHKRCLAVGMSPGAIKTGRYTHRKRDQDLREIRRLQTASGLDGPPLTDVDVDSVVAALLEANRHVPTNADVAPDLIERRSRETYESSQLRKDAFGLHGALSAEEYEEIYSTTGLDVDGRRGLIEHMAKCMERFIVGHVRFAKGVPGFKALPVNDQAGLLKVALSELWFLAGYKGFRKKYGTFYSLSGVVHTYSQNVHMSGKEGNDYMLNLADNFQKWDVTNEELVVLKAICLTFTDRCELGEPGKVEAIQTMMLKCFYMLLSRRHENTNMALAQALGRLVALRDMTEMERRHHTRSFVKDVYKEHPMLMEVIL